VIQAASLNSKLNQFESELSLQGIQQISPAKSSSAELVEPKPKKNAIFGFAFGLLLAAVAAFIAERFDRSLRSLTSIEQASEEPILAALPSVKSPIAHIDGQPVLSAPLLEPVRRVQSTLRLREAAVDGAGERANVLVCTSADAGDGKSTLVAALALVMREAGQRVAVVEADFRRPVLAKLLNVGGDLGLADVLAGSVSVEDALQAVPGSNASVSAHESAGGGSATAVRSRTRGSISVLIGAAPGERPPSLAGGAMSELLGSLAEDFDSVLIDAPSPLEASDTISLLSEVDGIVVVARVRHTRDVSSQRLADLVSLPSTAPVLGIVVNDVSPRELQRSGLSAGHGQRGWPSSLAGR
jgi:Mrp family chromosome partitioning ATPase